MPNNTLYIRTDKSTFFLGVSINLRTIIVIIISYPNSRVRLLLSLFCQALGQEQTVHNNHSP